jgi:hypothetical protein
LEEEEGVEGEMQQQQPAVPPCPVTASPVRLPARPEAAASTEGKAADNSKSRSSSGDGARISAAAIAPTAAPDRLLLAPLRAALSGAEGPQHIDLQGYTYHEPQGLGAAAATTATPRRRRQGPQHVVVSRRGVVIENGVIELPPGVCLVIEGDDVVLRLVKITGAGAHPTPPPAPLTPLQQKQLEQRGSSTSERPPPAGLITVAGRNVVLDRCVVQGVAAPGCGPSHGVFVGHCASASARGCGVFSVSGSGWCTAGYGATLATRGGCRAEDAGWGGFVVLDGGEMALGKGTIALRSGQHGMAAGGAGSLLRVGAGSASQDSGWAGVAAVDGAHVLLGENVVAEGNQDHGVSSAGSGSNLTAGAGCRSLRNAWCGFAALDGGQLMAGDGCESAGNKHSGWGASGAGSRLVVGGGSRASGNGHDGYTAVDGGELVAGDAAVSADNAQSGFAAAGRHTKLSLGSGWVSRDRGQAVRASAGAEVTAWSSAAVAAAAAAAAATKGAPLTGSSG